MIQPLVISAPWGNYLHFRHMTPTLGTFTPERRGGGWYRLWRVLQTLRPVPFVGGAWVNRLELPNPGIDWLVHQNLAREPINFTRIPPAEFATSNSIISVTAFDPQGWRDVLQAAFDAEPLAVEMNVSCPNVAGGNYNTVSSALRVAIVLGANRGVKVIVKLPPVGYDNLLCEALGTGIQSFHCCNTLPTPKGGLSGKPLKPLALECVRQVRREIHARGLDLDVLIGGGGVTTHDDARDYLNAGATHVAVGSAWLNPFRWRGLKRLARELAAENTKGAIP